MKYVVVAFLIAIVACRKSPSPPLSQPELVMSKSTIKRGELVTASVMHAPPGTRFYWELPGHTNQVASDNSKASTLFTLEGTYELTVSLVKEADSMPYAWYTKKITVSDEDFQTSSLNGNNTYHFNGDQVTITPFFMRDSTLAFILSTGFTQYNLNTYIVTVDQSVSNQVIKFSLDAIWHEPTAKSDNVPVKNILFTRNWYEDGVYPVEVTFNNVPYYGMLKVSAYRSKYEFTWLHTSGVLIEPKVISKY